MLQVWSMVNLEIKFQIRLSNGILMDCWPISCGMAASKSGWNTINFLGSVLKSFLDKKEMLCCANLALQMEKVRQNCSKSQCIFNSRSLILCVCEHPIKTVFRNGTPAYFITGASNFSWEGSSSFRKKTQMQRTTRITIPTDQTTDVHVFGSCDSPLQPKMLPFIYLISISII